MGTVPPAAAWRARLAPPSAVALVAANLVPLYGALFWDWPVFALLVLYWLEIVIVGIMTVIRMLCANPSDGSVWVSKLFMVPLFCSTYGVYAALYGGFIFSLFGGKVYDGLLNDLDPYAAVLTAVREFDLWIAIAALAASHLVSFFWNYLGRGEYRRATLSELFAKDLLRIFVLHPVIFVGGLAAFRAPIWALFVLIGLKIGIDLHAHLKEHRDTGPAALPS